MSISERLDRGRRSFARRRWADAYAHLLAADGEQALEPEDLERLAAAAYLIGHDAESADSWARAHQGFLGRGAVERAVRCAFWLVFGLLNSGEQARAGGWLARARRLLDDCPHDCVEEGYLLLPVALRSIFQGENAASYALFGKAGDCGERFGDRDLVALARHGQGRARIRMGDVDAGVALLDEAMAAVEAGEVSPIVAGDVYCSLIEACHEIFDMRRAREWTAALSHWCDSQPDLVPYRGQCLVRRAEILQLQGEWRDAMEEAQRACEWLLRPPPRRAAGAAFYQRAELHRLRGELVEAEEAYRQASQWGRKPLPGLAQLRLAQGQLDAAEAAIRRGLDEAEDRVARTRLLPAHVEIMLAADRTQEARAAADELLTIAAAVDAPFLHAASAHAQGAVLLAEGAAGAALSSLRKAWAGWQELEAPYEAARARVLAGLACRDLGDEDTAEMELDAARCVFQQLDARPELTRVKKLSRRGEPATAGGLTARELQVLRLIAAGKTNRLIASELFISERTVERHVSNIFVKLGLTSRAAATAHAYEHQLI
jgi:ATP/maltotriose-dependent transcriptional regulator MalT